MKHTYVKKTDWSGEEYIEVYEGGKKIDTIREKTSCDNIWEQIATFGHVEKQPGKDFFESLTSFGSDITKLYEDDNSEDDDELSNEDIKKIIRKTIDKIDSNKLSLEKKVETSSNDSKETENKGSTLGNVLGTAAVLLIGGAIIYGLYKSSSDDEK